MKPNDPNGPEATSLANLPRDVLVVEDDPLIALDVSDTILKLGVMSARVARSAASALKMIAEQPPDFVLLDVGLIQEKSFAVAERLEVLKIPFVFVTGYAGGGFPPAFAHATVLTKPYTGETLLDALRAWRAPA